ncbi:Ketoreductase CTB6 [Cladobotryum mycophilum]|uniref:Ketoreductase CTB6 n=1 Tax=Cladobotryum mycophilum TaxID=491253 RepID=A0ABR0ST57_9HYPO
MPGNLVLITGVTGHLGFPILTQALDAGYHVRAAVRSEAKAQSLLEAAPLKARQTGSRLTFAIVPDLTAPGAYDEAVNHVQYIIHVASPIPSPDLTVDQFQTGLIDPAVKGTLEILESARKASSIRRVVITSSIAAILPFKNLVGGGDTVYTAEDRISTPDIAGVLNTFQAYAASKAKAFNEAEAWVSRERPTFDVIHVHPSFVMGRDELQTSRQRLRSNGTNQYIVRAAVGEVSVDAVPGTTVHVDDVARVHVGALSSRIIGNTSYIVTSNPPGLFHGNDYGEVGAVVAKYFPDALATGALSATGKQPHTVLRIDATKTEKDLGFTHLAFEDQIKDVISQYLELDAES